MLIPESASNASFSVSVPEANSDTIFARLDDENLHAAYRVVDWQQLAPGPGTVAWARANARFNEVFTEHSLSTETFSIVSQIPCNNNWKEDLFYAAELKRLLPEYIKYERDPPKKEMLECELEDVIEFFNHLLMRIEEEHDIEIDGL